ncbi:MAG: TIGR03943 family protein [Actinomycetota bacterium]|jgi:uncharacterized repeat protein (TIGR03943 family)
MNEEAQAGLIFALGAVALRLGLTNAHLAYIQPAMGPALAVAGAVLVVLGGVILLRPGRTRQLDPGAHDHHHHGGGSRVGWLLVAPILAIAVVAPSPLGAFAASRAPTVLPTLTRSFGPLPPPRAGAVDLPLTEFVGRAVHGQGESLRAVPVRLIGFATPDARGDGFLLTRFVINCCAADARPVRVAIRGAERPWPAADTWLEVTGTWRPETRRAEETHPPTLELTALRPIAPPENRYLR